METASLQGEPEPAAGLRVLIVSEIRFLCEGLSTLLGRDGSVIILGHAAELRPALDRARCLQPDIVLLDAAFPGGADTVREFHALAPEIRVVALAVAETEDTILAWAEAGVVGYVPNTASLSELTTLLADISRGEQACPARIAGGLLRRLADAARRHGARTDAAGPAMANATAQAPLTARELQILRLIGAGLSNKDIARRLGIGLSTTKSHVHNLLGKLNVQRRGQATARMAALRGQPAWRDSSA